MEKIIFYYVANSNDDPSKIFYLENKNSRLGFVDGKFVFKRGHNDQVEEVEVKVFANAVNFDKRLADEFCSMVDSVMLEASQISKEKVGPEIEKGGLCAVISASINKSIHENLKSIFEFVADIFIGILRTHKLENGNKRVAVVFLRRLLEYFGYYFFWSRGIKKDWRVHETIIVKFVEDLESREGRLDNGKFLVLKKQISDWIKKSCVVDLQFRWDEKH